MPCHGLGCRIARNCDSTDCFRPLCTVLNYAQRRGAHSSRAPICLDLAARWAGGELDLVFAVSPKWHSHFRP
jgi:hypothetical protein